MSKRILINASTSGEVWAVFVENGTLEELFVESNRKTILRGNIYRAHVESIDHKLQAAFINYGTDRYGFISIRDILPSSYHRMSKHEGIPPIHDVLKVGQPLLVQIKKEESAHKGAAFTTDITLASAYTVISPVRGGESTLSRKLSDAKAKRQLKAMVKKADPNEQYGVMIRTAAESQSVEDVLADFQNQVRVWGHLQAEYHQSQEPCLLYQESSLMKRMIRDHFSNDVDEIWVDDSESYQQLKEYCTEKLPLAAQRLHHYQDKVPLFVRFNIEEQINDLTAHNIDLPSGGNISINHTEALTVVDINSSRQSGGGDQQQMFLNTNCEAAVLIARQLRLRGIGGLVVIDFINMRDIKHRKQVEKFFKEAIKKDRAHLEVGHLSRFCILELSRNRIQERSLSTTHTTCPTCEGSGFVPSANIVAFKLINLLYSYAEKIGAGQTIRGKLPVKYAMYLLNEKRKVLIDLEERYQIKIEIEADLSLLTLPTDPFATTHQATSSTNKAKTTTKSEGGNQRSRRSKRPQRPQRSQSSQSSQNRKTRHHSSTRSHELHTSTQNVEIDDQEPFTPPQIVGFISEEQMKKAENIAHLPQNLTVDSQDVADETMRDTARSAKVKAKAKTRSNRKPRPQKSKSSVQKHPRPKPVEAKSEAKPVEAKHVEAKPTDRADKGPARRNKAHRKTRHEASEVEATDSRKPQRPPRKSRAKTKKEPVDQAASVSTQTDLNQTDRMSAIKSIDQDLHSDLKRIRQKLNSIVQQEPLDEDARFRAEQRARNRAKRMEHLQSLSHQSEDSVEKSKKDDHTSTKPTRKKRTARSRDPENKSKRIKKEEQTPEAAPKAKRRRRKVSQTKEDT